MTQQRKKPVFLIFLGFYTALWIAATVIVCIYLSVRFRNYQKAYDAASAAIQPDAVAEGELWRFDSEHIAESLPEDFVHLNRYEDPSAIDSYLEELLSGKSLSCGRNGSYTEMHPSYDVYSNNLFLGTLTLKHKPETDAFGLCDYTFSSLDVMLEKPETLSCTIECFEGDDVLVNGQLLEQDGDTVRCIRQEEAGSLLARRAAEKSGVSLTVCTYTLTGFLKEPEILSDDRRHYEPDEQLKERMKTAGEAFVRNMNLWEPFSGIAAYLEPGGPAYKAISSAQSGLTWAGRPEELRIDRTEIENITKYDDATLLVTTRHDTYRLYRGIPYDETFLIEWLWCRSGNEWRIRDLSYQTGG